MSLTSMKTLTRNFEKSINSGHYHYQSDSQISEQSIEDFELSCSQHYIQRVAGGFSMKTKIFPDSLDMKDIIAWGVGTSLRIHDLWISETPFATHSGGQSANHSSMKTEWHQGLGHCGISMLKIHVS